MTPVRATSAVFVTLVFSLLPAMLAAEDKKPEITDVTADQLWKEPEKYHGKLVRIEGVVENTPAAGEHKESPSGFRYGLTLEDTEDVYISCDGKPSVAKGDRVRVTGLFTYKENSFVKRRLAVAPPQGTVEKVAEKKDEPVAGHH
jgi:hypothetical protein